MEKKVKGWIGGGGASINPTSLPTTTVTISKPQALLITGVACAERED